MQKNFTPFKSTANRARIYPAIVGTLIFIMLLLTKSVSAQITTFPYSINFSETTPRVTFSTNNRIAQSFGLTNNNGGENGVGGFIEVASSSKTYKGYLVISNTIDLTPGINYNISIRARSTVGAGNISIIKGATINDVTGGPGAVPQTLLSSTSVNVSSNFSTYTTGDFTVAANETRYISFFLEKATNTGNNAQMIFDNITITATCSQTPIVSIIPQTTTSFCTGGSVVLTSNVSNLTNGRFTYQWYNGTAALSGETGPTYTARTAGNYNVVVTNANLCVSAPSNSITVTVNTPPSVTISDPAITCAGTATTVTANPSGGSGSYSYAWSGPISVGNVSSFQTTTPGSYSVIITDTETGCISAPSPAKAVTFNPLPQVTLNFQPVCAGLKTTVSAVVSAGTGPFTYNWTELPNGVSNPGNVASFQTDIAGTYGITVTGSQGCSVEVSRNVTFNPLPTVTLNSQPVCIGTAATVSAVVTNGTGPFTYNWVVPAGADEPGNTVGTFTTIVPGEYSVTVVDNNECASSATATTNVIINPLPATPSISANGPTTFCPTGSVTLTATGSPNATTFTWYNGTTVVKSGPDDFYVANTTGNYTVVASDVNTCNSAASNAIAVFVYSSNNIITGGPGNQRSFCQGATATLTALADTEGSYSYQWFKTTDAVVGNNDDTQEGTGPSLTVNAEGDYYLILTVNGTNGCSITSEIISVVQTPAITTHQLSVANSIICENTAPGLITGTIVGGNGASSYEIVWEMSTTSDTDGFVTIANETTQNLNYTQPLTTDTWFRQTVTSVNCTSVKTLKIDVTPRPVATIDADGPRSFCPGGSVTLTASDGDSWLWSNGQTSQSITVNQTGNFSVTVTQNGCSATSDQVGVTVNPLPVVSISSTVAPANGSIAICANTTVTLTANPAPALGISYLWSNGETGQSITVGQADTYSVTVTNSNNCSASATATVTVKSVPPVSISIAGTPQTEYTVYTGDGNIPIQGLANGQPVSGTFDINGATIGNTLSTCVGSNLGTPSNTPKTLTFTYTTTDGCTVKATAKILFQQSTFSVVVLSNPKPFCQGDNVLHEAFVYRDANIIYPYLVDPVTKVPVRTDGTPIGPQELPVSNPDFPFPANTPDVVKFYAYRFFNPIVLSGTPVTSGLTYQWTKNQQQNIGNDGKTFENAGLSSLDYYAAYVTASSAASTCGPNFTNRLSTRTYTGQIAEYGISIQAVPNPVCPGVEVAFSATLNSGFTFWNDINLQLNWVLIRGGNRTILKTTPYTGNPAELQYATTGPTGGFLSGDQVTIEYTSDITQFYGNSKCSGEATANVITLQVIPQPAITSITAPTVCEGSPASLIATATGAGLTFEWFRVGTTGSISSGTSTTVNGVTTNTLALGNTQLADNNSQYYVVVSGTCNPPVTSTTVTLTVNPLPIAQPLTGNRAFCRTYDPDGVRIGLTGSEANTTYRLMNGTTAIETGTINPDGTVSFNTYLITSTNYSILATNPNCSTTIPVTGINEIEQLSHIVSINGPEEPQIEQPATYTAVTFINGVPTAFNPTNTYIWSITILGQAKKTYTASDPADGITIDKNTLTIASVPIENMTIEVQETITDGRCVFPLAAIAELEDINPLPVELLYLKATKQNNNVVELEWATAMEQNSEGFEVQVSQDAKNYRTLAFVASKAGGNTNEKQVYFFHDKENGKYGTRYYRLMQRDMNGDAEYFGPKAVQIGEATESLTAYPNPFKSEVTLDINAEEAGSMHVLVTNAIGAKVLERTLKIEKGNNKQTLQFNGNLPQGMYNITTRQSGKVQHFKLLKQQ